jgi:energy-coupling factor transporter ATP-binding protein EcfA2
MPNSDELIAIVERILNGSRDESEVAQLRQWLQVSGTTLQFVSQDGKFNTNIGQVQGGEIHIGDRIYQFDVEALRELLQLTTPLPNIDWHGVSQAMLEEQLWLTTNPLTSGEGISYRTEQVYVLLGLVERKWQTRRREDVSPEQGSLLYEETEITQRFEHEQFLEQVLWQGQSPKSRGKRLAIIGEPGAGKTTLLQQIAQWVSEQGEGAIAIWVSLADLRGQELEPYLLERWLQAVARKLGQAEASGQVKDAFVAQFQQGRVWLLLDGVDEMQVSSGNPLAEMWRQVRMGGLLSQARIVLSCRLNLWDGNRNALDTFDTYRTLEFSYPQQVEQFIGQWFGALPEVQGEQAERLCAALKEPGKERIRDLVKNPLRLTLLCFNWYLGEGTLPETKAGLYEQFVADFYEWKREQFPTTAEQRRHLNAALGELAREAIDKEATRFRLRHDFVCEFLGEPDELNSLFQLALQLGWLNKVGVDAENPRKAVYAFFPPTFQEYFAALAINNWRYLLNHFSGNPTHTEANYRIFEMQWKQVFLLWLGREDIKKQEKEIFVKSLINFKAQCHDFYWYRAYFLAAAGVSEFKDCKQAQQILEQITRWCLKQVKLLEMGPIAEGARLAWKESDQKKAIAAMKKVKIDDKFLNTNSYHAIHFACHGFTSYEDFLNINIANNPTLNTQVQPNEFTLRENGEIQIAADLILENLFLSTPIITLRAGKNSFPYWRHTSNLEAINLDKINCIETLIQILQTSQDEFIKGCIAYRLGNILPDNEIIINTLIELTKSTNYEIQSSAVDTLGEFGKGSYAIVKALIKLIQTESGILCEDAAYAIKNNLNNNSFNFTVSILKKYIDSQSQKNDSSRYEACYDVIWYCAQKMSYTDFYDAWHNDI